jgi:hypothetical protein
MTSKIDRRLLGAAVLSFAVLSAGPAAAKGRIASLFKRDKTPVVLHSRAFSVPKAGEDDSKNQDSHAADVVAGRFAVGDGVSRAAHPREWSAALTEGFVKAVIDPAKLVDSLGSLRALWKKKVDDKLDARDKAASASRQTTAVVHAEPVAKQKPTQALSLFEDFAAALNADTHPQQQHVEAPKSPGDELLADLAANPGRVKKSAPKPVVVQQQPASNIGDGLVRSIGAEKTAETGASSTLLGLEVKPTADGKATWVSSGLRDVDGRFSDSVMFQVRKRKGVVGWVASQFKGKMKTVDHWPPLEGKDFDSAPAQLRTKTDADELVHIVTKEGTAKRP